MNLKYGATVYTWVLIFTTAGAFFRAFVIAALWRWFAQPLGLPAIGMAHAYGFGLLINYVSAGGTVKDRDIADLAVSRDATSDERRWYVMIHVSRYLLVPAMVLGFGYLARTIMVGP